MARQKGILKLEGTIAEYTFYKTAKGYFAREKGGVSSARIANDPNFRRTRENCSEFGRAGKAGKLFRTVFRELSVHSSDSSISNRLTKLMLKVIQADATNVRGQRNVIDGEAELLKNFEFNNLSQLNTTLLAPYTVTMNRVTGIMEIAFNSFIPETMIKAPEGATHYKLQTAGAAIDFENEDYEIDIATSNEQIINAVNTAPITLTTNVTAATTRPLFMLLGIEFFQEVNGKMYPLKNGNFNALKVIEVNGGV